MKSVVLKSAVLLACLAVPAVGCGEKVTKVDPATAAEQMKKQQEMVQQERAN